MSRRATDWAWKQDVQPVTKLVLLALADYESPNGEIFPKQKTLAADCRMTREAVNRHIKKLLDAGLVEVTHKKREDGSFTSNIYHLCGGTLTHDHTVTRPDDHTVADPPFTIPPGTELRRMDIEPERVPQTPQSEIRPGRDAWFTEFWKAYPRCERKTGKDPCRVFYLANVNTQEIHDLTMAALKQEKQSDSWQRGFINMPLVWLHKKRWLDDLDDAAPAPHPAAPSENPERLSNDPVWVKMNRASTDAYVREGWNSLSIDKKTAQMQREFDDPKGWLEDYMVEDLINLGVIQPEDREFWRKRYES